ncbi:MAG: GNAT family N-acetyltransferase [Paracoccaceae bacterium]|nr:GNAT family N-acetyltransferase [Paracoccaceae bacterium]
MTAIIVSWNSDRACDPAYVASHYIAAADQLTCTVALDPHRDGMVLGFQSLKLAQAKNIYDVAPGWGVIGTYVALDTGRKGIGRRLFDATLAIAQQVGLADMDATIGADNAPGLAYYDAMGFKTYQRREPQFPSVLLFACNLAYTGQKRAKSLCHPLITGPLVKARPVQYP